MGNNGGLGRDFWLYRLGQTVSVVGDACSTIALAWWILDATGSAASLASVIAPSMLAQVLLLPLAGPLGDRFSRKHIILIADIWRAVITLVLAAMAFGGYFNLGVVAALYVLLGAGTAVFNSAATSIVPKLVPEKMLDKAMSQSQAIMSLGSIVGGVIGGLLVSAADSGGAFLTDGISFIIAAVATRMIKADTTPDRAAIEGGKFSSWFKDIKEGFRVIYKIPLQFWLMITAAVANFSFAPTELALPVLVKQIKELPAWYLGALNASVSLGMVIGSLVIMKICSKIKPDIAAFAGLFCTGISLALLPLPPGMYGPPALMFMAGFGLACVNIPIMVQSTLALPDRFRSRVGAVSAFMSQAAMPLGTALGGGFIAALGVQWSMLICGGTMAAMSLALFAIPRFSEFMRLPQDKAAAFYETNYPQAFK